MKKKSNAIKGTLIVGLLCLALFTMSVLIAPLNAVYADSPLRPKSFIIEVEGGTKVFYYTVSGEEDEEHLALGLYYNTGENIYLIEEGHNYIDEHNFVLSADGMNFAFLPWSPCSWTPIIKNLNGTAIMLFTNGQLQKTYAVKKVLKDPYRGDYSVSHVSWENTQKRNYDPTKNELTVVANDNTSTTFNLGTGKIVSSHSPVTLYFTLFIVLLCLVIAHTVFLHIKRKRKASNKT